MNPETGAVYALGSLPTLRPNVISAGACPSTVSTQLTDSASGEPLLNRAIQSAGPTGSTFKPITAMAALQSGAWRIDETFDDTGEFCAPARQQCRHNSGHAVDGSARPLVALEAGSDDFFYNLGARTNGPTPTTILTAGRWTSGRARSGSASQPAIDLPATTDGTLPTPRWRAERNQPRTRVRQRDRPVQGRRQHPPGGCGIADGTDRPWSIGDNESLAVGQGDVQISPLQLAVAYAAIANGGTIVRPHLGTVITTPAGASCTRSTRRQSGTSPSTQPTFRRSATACAGPRNPRGHLGRRVRQLPQPVYGKTGTAQYINQPATTPGMPASSRPRPPPSQSSSSSASSTAGSATSPRRP